MLDCDLAELFKCKNWTKEVNQAVKNNPEKFPDRFSWKLSDNDFSILRSKILTSNDSSNYGGRRYNPRVFTEQGIYMLAIILRSDVATEVSIRIMDAFVAMRNYISDSEMRIVNLESKVFTLDNELGKINKVLEGFNKNKKLTGIYYTGEIYAAYSAILNIFSLAKRKLIIIDSFADKQILDIISSLKVKVILITDKKNSYLKQIEIDKYNEEFNNLKVIYNNSFHDRFFIIYDKEVYHCGSSINRIGYKTFAINKLSDIAILNLFIIYNKEIIKS